MKRWVFFLLSYVLLVGCTTPDPAGQILDDTKWELDHAIIAGETRPLMSHETFEVNFSAKSVQMYDGCNHIWYENKNGRASYVATENGDFTFPWGNPTHNSTLIDCAIVNEETGQVYQGGGPDFMPDFEDIVAYELNAEQLLLYFPEDKQNVLVFNMLTTQP